MLLNVGCGHKFHEDWVNIDMVSSHPAVIEYNILCGLPFPSNQFDVVYHSQVLEHIPKEKSDSFLTECFRVLKPGGIIRVVLPDLENIVKEYQKYMNLCVTEKTDVAEANYDWILLEMYDQSVRNAPGGLMAKYFAEPELSNEPYVLERSGYIGRALRKHYQNQSQMNVARSGVKNTIEKITRNLNYKKIRSRLLSAVLTSEERESIRLGKFRNGGEIHYWMYDRFSLSRLLLKTGFENPTQKTPFESEIPNWATYNLDVKDGQVFDPAALFIEARKPADK
ncbi:methyltransferase domain-containing protein [Spirosoma sp. BT702]|uniref:Methyltransferase domain-containing protein n=1 Tax=Spirosoma profusum TaxID=2771354 RepID=A0A926XZF2_9BACT|nr:methyltransferase domain-containing protein [Spirosoma profusum]MBD2700683.1 methyltransferase domain-containing protein [Spirosoma profusum]